MGENKMNINEKLLAFLDGSPTCFQAVENVRQVLLENGYAELKESDTWQLENGRYFTMRNRSSIIAFQIPKQDFTGFMIGASHSDSPAFKIKENPEICKDGYVRLNVEKYGGMIMPSWFDRPLSVAGRLVVKENGRFVTKLVNVDRDLMSLPSLAIHMNRKVNDGYEYNAQKDISPLLGSEEVKGKFMDIVAKAAGVRKEDILGHDLFLYVRTKGCIWGAENEYVSAMHLDDLQCGFANMYGFLASEPKNSAAVFAVFDNEEVGSLTKQGANSTFLNDVLRRIAAACGKNEEEYLKAVSSSFMVSADNAHAIHPNHMEKADPTNRPAMNKGIVIKYNANQKYTTDAVSCAIFREICRIADVPVQDFTNRSDMVGGSTLGNLSNAHVSLNTVDVGLPQLAMHAPYETAGVKDTESLIKAMTVFFSKTLKDEGQGAYSRWPS